MKQELKENQGLPASLLWTLAIIAGISVANLYYNQPLLNRISRDLQTSEFTANLIAMITQIGYAIGLLFIIPLGDLFKRKTIILINFTVLVVSLLTIALTPYIHLILFASLLTGICSVIPGALAGLLAGSFDVGYYVWFLCVWAVIALVMIGPANKHNANDNTSGVVTLLEIARSLPESQRGKVCFVLFDLEEAGLIGSAAYRKAHKKASDSQLVLNLDCVGDGDYIRFFPTKKLKKDRKKLTSLYKACGYLGKKDVLVHEKGFSVCPSDQANFPYGVGICALRKKGKTLYLSRIHTPKDTILEETNVNILRAALITFITCGAAQ